MEHKKKIWLKGILAVALFIMVFITYLSPVFAEINQSYIADMGITEEDVSGATTDNTLLGPIAKFVYYIGAAIEWVLSSLSSVTIGMNTMPWADMILYNSVALLDVNFLNPNKASMLFNMQDIIKKIYFTIFSLAITFFGISVVIMAIKLAISSIAEEKAKYKSAITSWLMAIVLLFTMHYFMAFVFYLNESVVELASNIAKKNIKDNMEELNDLRTSEAVDRFIKGFLNADVPDSDKVFVLEGLFPITVNTGSKTYEWKKDESRNSIIDEPLANVLYKLLENQDSDFNKWLYGGDFWNADGAKCSIAIASALQAISFQAPVNLDRVIKAYNAYLANPTDAYRKQFANTFTIFDQTLNQVNNGWQVVFNNNNLDANNIIKNDKYLGYALDYMKYVSYYYNATYVDKSTNSNITTSRSPVSMLASYFKSAAFGFKGDSLVTGDANVTFCFLYTIFVFQSLLYFFAYVKRFYYIIILALMAPIVVVYDFVTKI